MPAPRLTLPRSPPLIAALLLLVAILIRCRDFGNPVIHVDEQFYLLVGDRMLHGALPYIDIWDRKPVGLFLIFAGIRLLPGDGILAYQLVATLFATATAWLVHKGARRLGASHGAALAAAIAYILWLSLLSGRGGQSPVFYNLFVTGAALLTLRLPGLAARHARRAIVANGAATCFLAGLAIQTKYTPAVEGAFFGLAHLWYLRRAGGTLPMIALSALLWIALAIAPTAAVMVDYWRRGPAVFDAFWFSNFASITLRKGYPAGKIVGRLAGNSAVLSPFILCTILAWRTRPWSPEKTLMLGWLAAALIAFAIIGAFFDHYALPLLAPLAILSAPVLGRHRIAIPAMFALGLALFVGKVLVWPTDAEGARALARVVKANGGQECPYVFAGDSITYLLADACLPTPHIFPSTLAYEPERGASGVDEVAEVRRILAHHPPVIVTMDAPMAEWNLATLALVETALKTDYRPVFRTVRDHGHSVVYLRRDRSFISPDQ
ncbi:ArnT family glycosyltransferase [Sphingomonas sp. GB1N7]|uniref:ArnT family glycosyltransferase n=1 Tax=Parasphingomonas caseinilytica TaxID=3096158 RepID=UPI002FCBB272